MQILVPGAGDNTSCEGGRCYFAFGGEYRIEAVVASIIGATCGNK